MIYDDENDNIESQNLKDNVDLIEIPKIITEKESKPEIIDTNSDFTTENEKVITSVETPIDSISNDQSDINVSIRENETKESKKIIDDANLNDEKLKNSSIKDND